MAILVDEKTRVLVQGITGKAGKFHAEQCLAYGTNIVAGVTPGKGGQRLQSIPIFDSVALCKKEIDCNATLIFVPAPFAKEAILEAEEAKIPLIICITEGIPVHDMLEVITRMEKSESRLIGPNCPGVITPEVCKLGIMPGNIHKKGSVGIVSRSGTLTYEAVLQTTEKNLGQSTCIGIGGDFLIGTQFIDILELFEKDDETEVVLLIGEIGGTDEEKAAHWIKNYAKKPVAAFIAGRTAPPGKRMGHAGAIISQGKETAEEKIAILRECGITVAESPACIGDAVVEAMRGK